jgi:hypothetical protein
VLFSKSHLPASTATANIVPIMDSKTMPKCAICGTPTTSKCTGCKSKFYCGEPCQSKDWHSHKKVCKVMQREKTLGRVAELVHEAYLTFRENTFDTSTLKIEEIMDALVMRNGYLTARTKSFVDFPRHIMKDDAMRKAVPCWLSCHEPFAWMHSLIRKLVEGESCIRLYCPGLLIAPIGLRITIEEVAVRLRWIPRKSIVINPNGKSHHNGPGYLHFVLRVTATDTGLKWALDFSGAQYGIFPVLWRWHDYEKCFIDIGKQLELYSHGVNRTLVAAWAEVEGAPSMAFGVIGRSAKGLDTSITLWGKDFMPCLSSLM